MSPKTPFETTNSDIRREILDVLEEELEEELDDAVLRAYLTSRYRNNPVPWTERTYFHRVVSPAAELVKLQDWVVQSKKKVVVIFEGRDSAGKGGVIKRITQRLNPRVCRVVALPAPNERERSNGISSAMFRIFLAPERSRYSTAPGTIGRALSG